MWLRSIALLVSQHGHADCTMRSDSSETVVHHGLLEICTCCTLADIHARRAMAPSSEHGLSKRSVVLDTSVLVAVIVCTVVIFNISLLLAWCTTRKASKAHTRELKQHNTSRSSRQGLQRSSHASQSDNIPDTMPPTALPSYPELAYVLQRSLGELTPPTILKVSKEAGEKDQPMNSPRAPAVRFALAGDIKQGENVHLPTSARRRSFDEETTTASIYSSMSAPLDYHDSLLLNFPQSTRNPVSMESKVASTSLNPLPKPIARTFHPSINGGDHAANSSDQVREKRHDGRSSLEASHSTDAWKCVTASHNSPPMSLMSGSIAEPLYPRSSHNVASQSASSMSQSEKSSLSGKPPNIRWKTRST